MNVNIDGTIKELLWTLFYILIVTIILPYFRFIAKSSLLFSIFLIFKNGKKLSSNEVYKNMTLMYTTNMPSRIRSIGKKVLFIDILRIEVDYMSQSFREYFEEKTYIKKVWYKRIWKLLKNYKYYTKINLSLDIIAIIDECKTIVPGLMVVDIYPQIDIKRSEIIRYIKNNKETLDIDNEEVEKIREFIQVSKARKIVSKYDELMLVYRNQLSANILAQFSSEKDIYEMLIDTLNTSILSVYINMRDTIDLGINQINGELDGIVYKGIEI